MGQLWEALAELWEALAELRKGLYIEKLPINRPSDRYVIPYTQRTKCLAGPHGQNGSKHRPDTTTEHVCRSLA